MRCLILAAGASTRMRPLTDAMPKCLLPLQGTTLLERTIDSALGSGIEEIGIVIGYRREMIREAVRCRYPFNKIRFIVNPYYDSTNNAYSLLLARDFALGTTGKEEHSIVLLDSDILFPPGILSALLAIQGKSTIAVRVEGNHDDEEVRVVRDAHGMITRIGKEIPLNESFGESIGIEHFLPHDARALFEVLEQRVRTGNGRREFYEASFQELIERGHQLLAADITPYRAMELDTPEDYEIACAMITRGEG